ncbi:chitooligosaccharidolytic beta-N-acetylglucosaminidase-like [Homarus americanus]|uniref:chitooligosaccharidolytic beta-N-acetylglucosaminidase-like n=1 Tax=Homarus americanus TaxID=6706 RepID=UPI001C480D02|nr:chitooligosaccharidolytic beta-N-acetylglucosaminidase-like [Homarus americanus]
MRVLVVTTLVVAAAAENFYRLPSPYTYSCKESRCVKEERSHAREQRSLEQCQLTCGKYGSLWPQPTGEVQLSPETVHFTPRNMKVTKLTVSGQKVSEMLEEATRHFTRNIHFLHPDFPEEKKRPLTKEHLANINIGGYNEQQQQQQFSQQTENKPGDINEHNTASAIIHTPKEYVKFSPFLKERSSPRIERHRVNIEITVTSPEDKLTLDTDEKYTVDIQTAGEQTQVKIQATTYYGARHALESVSQLIAYDDVNNALQIVQKATIQDEPKFKYRGFMLDTGRNFYPKEDLMRLMDAMSYNKMNYFHWHITDAASFPLYSNRRPEMAYYGSYSPRKVYYPEDITEIVQYAKLRGISVIPELDGPAHTSAGWQWGEKEGKGNLVLCTGKEEPWFNLGTEPPSGQLNPVNPEVYNVLGELYSDMLQYFDPEMVHMGGDDVSFKCWEGATEIKEYLASNAREPSTQQYMELWNLYQNNAFSKLQEAAGQAQNITPIIHSSSFASQYIDKNSYIIQINEAATDKIIADYVNKGHRIILSNQDQWRLDCSGSIWVGDKTQNCAQDIPTWEHFYNNSPLDILYNLGLTNARSDVKQQTSDVNPRDLVLGGEATLWSSETDANGLQAKTWPRVSAMAERLWSDPTLPVQGLDTTQKRLNTHRQRMVFRGIHVDPIQPEYCMQDESACYSQEQYLARSTIPA